MNADDRPIPAPRPHQGHSNHQALHKLPIHRRDVQSKVVVPLRSSTPGPQPLTSPAAPGEFNVSNALAATAIGPAAGSISSHRPRPQSWPGAPAVCSSSTKANPSASLDFATRPTPCSARSSCCASSHVAASSPSSAVSASATKAAAPPCAASPRSTRLHDRHRRVTPTPKTATHHRRNRLGLRASARKRATTSRSSPIAAKPSRSLAMAVDEDAILLAGKGHEREVHLVNSSYPTATTAKVAKRVLREMGTDADPRRDAPTIRPSTHKRLYAWPALTWPPYRGRGVSEIARRMFHRSRLLRVGPGFTRKSTTATKIACIAATPLLYPRRKEVSEG